MTSKRVVLVIRWDVLDSLESFVEGSFPSSVPSVLSGLEFESEPPLSLSLEENADMYGEHDGGATQTHLDPIT